MAENRLHIPDSSTVDLMPRVADHWQYLKRLSEITADAECLDACRQEIAPQLFTDQDMPYLTQALGSGSTELGIQAEVANMLKWTLE